MGLSEDSARGGMPRLKQLAADLAEGRRTSQDLVARALAAIADPAGEGARAFLKVYEDQALTVARASDDLRRAGVPGGPLAGIPISIKDLFDIAGDPTPGGSRILGDAHPAERDAPVMARLRAAGAVFVGRTNMTEFAYSGLGLNPHFGTPLSPWDRATGRAPGGSTSGGAVSVADGMAAATIGSDTGGSTRIPAAFCGLTGFKPSRGRHPMDGVLPLAPSLDTVGPLGASVDCCRLLDAIMAGEERPTPNSLPIEGLRLLAPTNVVLDDMDEIVGRGFESALTRLSAAGAKISETTLEALDGLGGANAKGGFAAAESFAWHRDLLERGREAYDPRVSGRIQRGAEIDAADYLELLAKRVALREAADRASAGFDAIVMPTVAIVPPSLADLEDDSGYYATNALVLRNTSVANFLDRPAITLPIHDSGAAPVGLMLIGESGADSRLFDLAEVVEGAFGWKP
jgi:aspartyl-tRNA(Asn)/glutamyl-tRNA(Gln) amidotransferase subunit A